MSSNIPTRRTTRTTRATVLKDNENANARPARVNATRAKPPSTASQSSTATTRATGTTAASRAKAAAAKTTVTAGAENGPQHKRKREALGEVTGPANNKTKAAARGKGKEENAVGKPKEEAPAGKGKATVAVVINRPPLRTIGGAVPAARRTRSSTQLHQKQASITEVVEEAEVHVEEHAMQVDPPAAVAHLRRTSTAAASVTTSVVEPPAPKFNAARRLTSRPLRHPREPEDEEEAHRAFKKRRTSSEAGDEDRREAEEDEEEGADVFDGHKVGGIVLGDVEADPNGDDWDDLDAEDIEDPQMVSEYVVEIFAYLKEVEQTTMPNPNYMESQKELAWKMRGILTDWLVQVHCRFRLLPETLFLCVNIIDRFLSARVVSLAKLQLVGIACMFISAKVEEIVAPSASNFLYCADSSYTEGEILQAERYILKTLDWNLSYPNPMHFLRRISKADDYNVQVRTIGKYLMEISCLEWRLIAAPPSLLAGAAIWLARIILGRADWTSNLAHYSSYAESALVPTANLMLNYVLKPIVHQSFYKKYAAKKYLKTSTFVRDWALSRWEESTRVNLQAELPALKAMARAATAAEEKALAAAALSLAEEDYET